MIPMVGLECAGFSVEELDDVTKGGGFWVHGLIGRGDAVVVVVVVGCFAATGGFLVVRVTNDAGFEGRTFEPSVANEDKDEPDDDACGL